MPEHNNQPSADQELNKKRNERDHEPIEEQTKGKGESGGLPESRPIETISGIPSAEVEEEPALSSRRRSKEERQEQADDLESPKEVPVLTAHPTENEAHEEPAEDAELPKDKESGGQRSTGYQIAVKTLKILRIPLLCILVLFIGLWIGYSVIGGQPASEIFRIGTWKHIFDLIYQK